MRRRPERTVSIQCPYLMDHGIGFCSGAGSPYVPSIFELEEYCREPRHERCPFYLGSTDAVRAGSYQPDHARLMGVK